MFELVEEKGTIPKINVVGVGGGGGNAVDRMIEEGLDGVNFISINTDLQALSRSKATSKMQIGAQLTQGLGSGSDPEIGMKAAQEDIDKIRENLQNAQMVFITAGMGGGTGTGASPLVAAVAKDMNILTVAVVTKPFNFEGKKRALQAEDGIKALRQAVDTLIVIPNQKLLTVVSKQASTFEAFKMVDSVLLKAVKGISELIIKPGVINLDFADVKTVVTYRGDAIMGIGTGVGENKAIDAAQEAISCPLLEDVSIEGAKGVIINVTGGDDLTLLEATEAVSVIQRAAGNDADVYFGLVKGEKSKVNITVFATGIGECVQEEPEKVDTDELSLLKSQEYRDIPTFLRHKKKEERIEIDKGKLSTISIDDLEIPTFLRKQMD
ncbi:cell division protein FtsZ [candidate division WOR-3 bacterium]|nr:cell division protein FtsZ [candidate division WOR-3 bacterium]MCK4576139.1 cell division protein FtsZ [candidate division WOR-3 bacterium]